MPAMKASRFSKERPLSEAELHSLGTSQKNVDVLAPHMHVIKDMLDFAVADGPPSRHDEWSSARAAFRRSCT